MLFILKDTFTGNYVLNGLCFHKKFPWGYLTRILNGPINFYFCIQSGYGKKWTRKNSVFGHFSHSLWFLKVKRTPRRVSILTFRNLSHREKCPVFSGPFFPVMLLLWGEKWLIQHCNSYIWWRTLLYAVKYSIKQTKTSFKEMTNVY